MAQLYFSKGLDLCMAQMTTWSLVAVLSPDKKIVQNKTN